MPRPKIQKMVCRRPDFNNFHPGKMNENSLIIVMSLEEYEVIRLIDNKQLSQEECALQMQVSRPTVQLLYSSARKKISSMLVEGAMIKIEGGNYQICNDPNCEFMQGGCRCHGRGRNNPII
ncbi:MAG: DUF134 domain-containing protein [Clostridia bacterium]